MSREEMVEETNDKDQTTPEAVDETPETTEAVSDEPSVNGDQEKDALQSQIDDLKRQAQENLEGWQRSRAEFTNLKRRTEREFSEIRERAALDTLTKLLPIIDDFERAIDNIPEEIQENSWVSGTSLILKKFEKLLEEYRVEAINPVGESFDPHFHEAVGMDDTDEYESGIVTTTLQKGYKSGERVLRPALVRVAN